MIEVYAITDDSAPTTTEGAPVTMVPADGLAAVCGPASSGTITAETLWRHEEVVEALMRDRDLLPVRYGTLLTDEDAAARVVAEHHDEFRAALDRVRGAIELSLRVVIADHLAPPAIRSGTEYMRARARVGARREAAVATIHEPLSLLARESSQRSVGRPPELLRAAYLVDRGTVECFTGLVERLQTGAPDMQLLCTGPWPPYSFVRA